MVWRLPWRLVDWAAEATCESQVLEVEYCPLNLQSRVIEYE